MVKVFVQGLIFKDNKILLMKRQNTGYMDNYYGTPGGHLENNESIIDGLKREIKEETDMNVIDSKLISIITRYNEDDTYIDFVFKVSGDLDEIKNNELDKCSEILYFEKDNIESFKNIIPHIKNLLTDKWDSDEVKLYSYKED